MNGRWSRLARLMKSYFFSAERRCWLPLLQTELLWYAHRQKLGRWSHKHSGYQSCLEILSDCWNFVNRAMQTSFVKFRQGTLHIIGQKCYPSVRRNGDAKGRYVFLLEGVGRGILEFFCKKKSWPSHFPEWIDAWPFTNTDTKTPDPPPTSSKTKITGSENN